MTASTNRAPWAVRFSADTFGMDSCNPCVPPTESFAMAANRIAIPKIGNTDVRRGSSKCRIAMGSANTATIAPATMAAGMTS